MSTRVVYGETKKSGTVVTTIKEFADDRLGLQPVTDHKRRESLQQTVEESLSLFPGSEVRPTYIGPDHECFNLESAVAFREKHDIDVNSNKWRNFQQLLCGCQDLPFIILQNPSKSHVKDYREMKKCRTMKWLSTTLEEIGLTLEEAVVLDVCSLLSDDDLDEMDRRSQDKWGAVEESYKMTEDILRLLKPDVVIAF
ncbi:hypothetical protein INS49_002460 [Diaporthe citri]|uniref:uncharacterized protein n=1 Tax=Diaporthe citri TaxID=83186 RepID=UPI001C7EFDC1|nr:uncharacterized protein INS49_002460 [Diaporthe citri]KAG6368258.1 hypothetical protein INS49_002460 [Diaporthe citri]